MKWLQNFALSCAPGAAAARDAISPRPLSMSQRFTIDGSDALERHLAETCDRVHAGIASLVPAAKLHGILLGGGYGRGEGGVLKTPAGDRPYNDLEFYVFVNGIAVVAERSFRTQLHALGKSLSPDAGLEVEFKVLTLEKLRRSPASMFYYDLVAAHRWVLGNDNLLAGCEHHQNAGAIPLHEATRLLFNRCSGLLFAKERLNRASFGLAESDYVARNLAKARLAFGDVVLAAHGEYHWSCRERHRRLLRCPHFEGSLRWAEVLKALHAEGVDFKLYPKRSSESRETLVEAHRLLTDVGKKLWLWLESRRLGTEMRSPRDHVFSPADKCPETAPWRNRLLNFRTFGPPGLVSARYPRQRLFHALALLLWEPEVFSDAELLGKTQSELQTNATDLPGLVSAYLDLWTRFN